MNSLVTWQIAPYVLSMDVFVFVILLGTCFAAGATGALFQPGSWYQVLNKPVWTPPNWAFPLVWTTIYFSVSFAGARVANMEGSAVALAFWAMQVGFSTLWTPVFFWAAAIAWCAIGDVAAMAIGIWSDPSYV